MRLLPALLLCCTLWLAGCAGAPPQSAPPAPPAPAAVGTGPATAASDDLDAANTVHVPEYPHGPLRPILSGRAGQRDVAGMRAPQDLWERIRGGFSMPDLNTDLVREREQWYASRPDYLQRMTLRSSKYLFHIVEELERRGMPTELALLPYIESAFNPQAVSSARAAGMWQFMPATGSYFDLKQNAFRDDRRDVLASTRAALDYLQKLYAMFGDWHLALAAYNWGEGSVSRAIARNEKLGLGTRYTELSMPAETRLYVPKLQAVKNIIAAPERFGSELPLIENHPYFQRVEITRDIDVRLAANLAGVREEDFRALNPSLHKPVILAAGLPYILLPWDNAQVFRRNFQAYTEGQYASWTVWSVPSTMNVASAAQRAGMSIADLRQVNNIPSGMMIKAGSALMVPRTATQAHDVPEHLADNGQVRLAPEVVTRRTTVRARKGESVASLARRYRVAAADVAHWNNVRTTSHFKTGEQVVMYLPLRAGKASAAGAGKAGAKKSKAPTRKKGGTPTKRKR